MVTNDHEQDTASNVVLLVGPNELDEVDLASQPGATTFEGESVDEAGRVPTPEGTPVDVEDGAAFAAVEPESLVFVSLELAGAAGACAN